MSWVNDLSRSVTLGIGISGFASIFAWKVGGGDERMGKCFTACRNLCGTANVANGSSCR